MSSTPTTVATPTRAWSIKHYTILIALVLALAAGILGVYSMTGSDVATTATNPALTEDVRVGGGGCSANSTVGGGLVEGQSVSDTCGAAGGSGIPRGVQP